MKAHYNVGWPANFKATDISPKIGNLTQFVTLLHFFFKSLSRSARLADTSRDTSRDPRRKKEAQLHTSFISCHRYLSDISFSCWRKSWYMHDVCCTRLESTNQRACFSVINCCYVRFRSYYPMIKFPDSEPITLDFAVGKLLKDWVPGKQKRNAGEVVNDDILWRLTGNYKKQTQMEYVDKRK